MDCGGARRHVLDGALISALAAAQEWRGSPVGDEALQNRTMDECVAVERILGRPQAPSFGPTWFSAHWNEEDISDAR